MLTFGAGIAKGGNCTPAAGQIWRVLAAWLMTLWTQQSSGFFQCKCTRASLKKQVGFKAATIHCESDSWSAKCKGKQRASRNAMSQTDHFYSHWTYWCKNCSGLQGMGFYSLGTSLPLSTFEITPFCKASFCLQIQFISPNTSAHFVPQKLNIIHLCLIHI